VAPATGEENVAGASGTKVPNTGAGYQGSTGASGSTELGPANEVFTVRGATRHRALAAGQSIVLPLTFTPHGAGAAVADLTITTTAGTREVTVTGYGT